MSRHVVKNENIAFVFGWDQPLQSFYLQVHDHSLPEEKNPVEWLGSSGDSVLYEVEDLETAARSCGLRLTPEQMMRLFADKDDGI